VSTVPASQYQALHAALVTVTTAGQAIAAIDLAIGAVTGARDKFSAWSLDSSRRDFHDQLQGALDDLTTNRAPFAGDPSMAITSSLWDDGLHAVERAYNVMWSIQTVDDRPELQATLSEIADITTGTIAAMPQVISSAVGFVTDTASKTATGLIGGVAGGLLPLWPIVGVVVLVAVVGLAALAQGRKRGLL
jgi:hypothetical protein